MRTLYLLLIIFLTSLNLRPALTSIGPVLSFIQDELQMSNVAASFLTTLPVFCMGVFSLVAIKMSKTLGVERSLFIAMLILLMTTALRFFTHSSVMLIITALFAGVGIGIAGPLIAGFVKEYFPTKLNVMSVYSVSMIIGAAAASSFAMPLYHMGRESWRFSLSFWAIFALLAALLLLPLLRDGNKNKAQTSPATRHPHIIVLVFYFACMCSIFYMMTAWLATIALALDFTPTQAGLLLSLFTAVQVPMGIVVTELVTRFQRRRLWLFLCAFSECIGLLLLIFQFSPWVATVLIGIGAGGLFPLALLIPVQDAITSQQATNTSAIMQCFGFMIGSLGPLVLGFLFDATDHVIYPLLFVLAVNVMLMLLITRIKQPKQLA